MAHTVKAHGVADALAACGYVAKLDERPGSGRQEIVYARNGARLATVTLDDTGNVRVCNELDYGHDGRVWCDGRDYRAPAAAIRFVCAFLGDVVTIDGAR